MGIFDRLRNKKENEEKDVLKNEEVELNKNIIFVMSIFADLIDNQFCLDRKQLKDNGAIYYENGKNGTKFDWNTNEHISPFYVFYKNGEGAIKLLIYKDGTIEAFLYEKGKSEPCNTMSLKASGETAKAIVVLMYTISDCKGLFDQSLFKLDLLYVSNESDILEFEKEELI